MLTSSTSDKYVYIVIGIIMALSFSMLGDFWWLLDDGSMYQGIFILLILTAFTFNRVPEKGFLYLKNKEVKYFYLPLLIVNIIAFTVGVAIEPYKRIVVGPTNCPASLRSERPHMHALGKHNEI